MPTMPDIEIKKCRFCNKSLFPNYELGLSSESNQTEPMMQRLMVLERGLVLGYGYKNNGYFCNAKCGFEYAVDICKKE